MCDLIVEEGALLINGGVTVMPSAVPSKNAVSAKKKQKILPLNIQFLVNPLLW